MVEADHIAAKNRNMAILLHMAVVKSDWRGLYSVRAVWNCRLKSCPSTADLMTMVRPTTDKKCRIKGRVANNQIFV